MNDTITISRNTFNDIISLLDRTAEFLRIEMEHFPAPGAFHIEAYYKLEKSYNTLCSLEREHQHNELLGMIERMCDEVAEQLQFIAVPSE